MGATNHTTNYNLSQFLGADKPSWLQDYNGDMGAIDQGIHNAQVKADGADTKATANETALNNMLKFKGIHEISITYDGVETIGAGLNRLYAALVAYNAAKGDDYRYSFNSINPNTSTMSDISGANYGNYVFGANAVPGEIDFGGAIASNIFTAAVLHSSNSSVGSYDMSTNTLSSLTSAVPTADAKARLRICEFTL